MSSILQLQYDESTRRPMFADAKALKDEILARMAEATKSDKRWSRLWRRTGGGRIERGFSLHDLYDTIVVTYEKDGAVTDIEYHSNDSVSDAGLPAGSIPLASSRPSS